LEYSRINHQDNKVKSTSFNYVSYLIDFVLFRCSIWEKHKLQNPSVTIFIYTTFIIYKLFYLTQLSLKVDTFRLQSATSRTLKIISIRLFIFFFIFVLVLFFFNLYLFSITNLLCVIGQSCKTARATS